MGKDLWRTKGRKSRSLAQKAGLLAVNFGRIISGSSSNKENSRAPEISIDSDSDEESTEAEALLAATRAQLDEERQKVSEAKTALKNAWRREKRTQAEKVDLQERLVAEDAFQRELAASGTQLARSEAEVVSLKARIQELTKKNKALGMRVRRAPEQQEKAIKKAQGASSTFRLKEKGVVTEPTRELVMDLVSSYNVPVAHIDKLIKSVAETVGVTVEGSISERAVRRVALEGGVIAQIQIIDELQHSEDLTISGDRTTLCHVNYESKFVNFKTSLYNLLSGTKSLPKRVQRFLGISAAVDHTAETQIQGWKDVSEDMHEVFNSSACGVDCPVDPDSFPARITGMNADHAADQRKVGRGIGGEGGWKQEADRKIRGEKELQSWSREDLLPFILAESAKKVADAGGIDAFNALSAAEQDTRNKEMFIKICRDAGKMAFDGMPPQEQRATDLFIWAGCCMHKELNAVKGGNTISKTTWLSLMSLVFERHLSL
ncbi:hypothetical protein B0H10DRAFT_2227177 [Mycena sp. CBHHK59/15]|nr:hypothetical protein B0H10DRAFT_2227177 [Mycena sp. CBHHK59/15]